MTRGAESRDNARVQTHETERAAPRSPRRVRLIAAAALVCALGIIGLLLSVERDDGHDVGVAAGAATADITAPEPAIELATTPMLPIPDMLPHDARAPTPAVVVGRIEIPKIGVDEHVGRGITLTAIDRGPGWWPGTAMPGELGNVVVAGHRVTHSKPFNRIDELVEGDQVVFTTDAGRFTYEVRGVIVVPADWIDIAHQDHAHTATLFACHPKGSATHRVVAKLRLLDAAGTPVDADDALPAMDAEERRTDHTLVMRITDDEAAGGDEAASGDPFAGADG